MIRFGKTGYMHPSHTAPIRCHTTTDLLAALPFLAGHHTDNSLLVVIFDGQRASDALRIDLPPNDGETAVCDYLAALMRLFDDFIVGDRSPALVISTDRTFSRTGRTPWPRFTRELLAQCASHGWQLRECAIITPNGWAALIGPHSKVQRNLSEIASSRVFESLAQQGHVGAVAGSPTVLPIRDPQRAQRVQFYLGELSGRVQSVHSVARIAAACFGAEQTQGTGHIDVDVRLIARLIAAAQSTEQWVLLVLTAISDASFVITLAEAEDELVIAENITGLGVCNAGRLLEVLSSEPVPQHQLTGAITAANDALVHCPQDMLSGVRLFLAWAWWMLGVQSLAKQHIRDVLREDGSNELALVLDELTRQHAAGRVRRLLEKQRPAESRGREAA